MNEDQARTELAYDCSEPLLLQHATVSEPHALHLSSSQRVIERSRVQLELTKQAMCLIANQNANLCTQCLLDAVFIRHKVRPCRS